MVRATRLVEKKKKKKKKKREREERRGGVRREGKVLLPSPRRFGFFSLHFLFIFGHYRSTIYLTK
jgi:hypothetical protein